MFGSRRDSLAYQETIDTFGNEFIMEAIKPRKYMVQLVKKFSSQNLIGLLKSVT